MNFSNAICHDSKVNKWMMGHKNTQCIVAGLRIFGNQLFNSLTAAGVRLFRRRCWLAFYAHIIWLFIFDWLFVSDYYWSTPSIRNKKFCMHFSLTRSPSFPFAPMLTACLPPNFLLCAKSSEIRVFCLLVATTYFSNFKNKQWFSEFRAFFLSRAHPFTRL